mmetsp:Transcript_58518/g.124107  ORF Transcript_58518/g.124107 Transcript_58518/m.124107 type:complete len:206 (+) Transcript_58518:2817-3434(+)
MTPARKRRQSFHKLAILPGRSGEVGRQHYRRRLLALDLLPAHQLVENFEGPLLAELSSSLRLVQTVQRVPLSRSGWELPRPRFPPPRPVPPLRPPAQAHRQLQRLAPLQLRTPLHPPYPLPSCQHRRLPHRLQQLVDEIHVVQALQFDLLDLLSRPRPPHPPLRQPHHRCPCSPPPSLASPRLQVHPCFPQSALEETVPPRCSQL